MPPHRPSPMGRILFLVLAGLVAAWLALLFGVEEPNPPPNAQPR